MDYGTWLFLAGTSNQLNVQPPKISMTGSKDLLPHWAVEHRGFRSCAVKLSSGSFNSLCSCYVELFLLPSLGAVSMSISLHFW